MSQRNIARWMDEMKIGRVEQRCRTRRARATKDASTFATMLELDMRRWECERVNVDLRVFVQRARTARDNINCHRKRKRSQAITNELQ